MVLEVSLLTYSLLTWTGVCLCFVLGLILFVRRSRIWDLIEQLPGPRTLPVVGNALDLNVNHDEIFELVIEYTRVYFHKRIFRIWLGPQPYVIIYRPETAEPILSNIKHINKSYDYTFLQPWLGTGLLTSSGEKWRTRRKLLTPAFHFRILEDFIDIMNEHGAILADKFKPLVNGKTFNVFPYITLCALDIICDSAMGRHVSAQDNSDSDYVKAIYRISEIIQTRQTQPWRWPNVLFMMTKDGKEHKQCLDVLHTFSMNVIRERRQELKDRENEDKNNQNDLSPSQNLNALGGKRRMAFLDLLIHASCDGQLLSDEDIREEVDTFMFEGHDTTTAGINWALYLIGADQECQRKVQEELDYIFGDDDRYATSTDLKEMKYLECCIKEAQRLFPSVPMMARELKEDVDICGYTIPSGTTAVVITYMLHRDPDVYPDPEAFDPDRFLPENCQGRHPYAYVPFSAGPRNCIGQKFALMEEKVVLSSILRRYRVTSMDKREDLKLLAELILRPKDGIRLRLSDRKHVQL